MTMTIEEIEALASITESDFNLPCTIKFGKYDEKYHCPNKTQWNLTIDYDCCIRTIWVCERHYDLIYLHWFDKHVIRCRVHGNEQLTSYSKATMGWFRRI